MDLTANEIITRLNLAPHPEGGHIRQTWISEFTLANGRAELRHPWMSTSL